MTVHNNAVTLTGHVPTYWQKQAAKEAAKQVADVKAIVDEIAVCLDRELRITDEGLATRIANVLKWNVSNRAQGIWAEVKNGAVTLTGEVEWHRQRLNIEQNVAHVAGVSNVINLISVRPRASAKNIKDEIRAALESHAEVEAANIAVEATNGAVTLSGTVESLAELDRVEDAAWAAPGVSKVINNVRVMAS